MAVSASYLEYVLEQLGHSRHDIAHKRMFGGVGIYAGERFVAVIDNDRLFLKVDDANRPDFDREEMPPFQPFGDGTKPMTGYREAPAHVLEHRDELARWVEKSWNAAGEKKTKKKVAGR
jgi:DNA transformation protein